MDITALIVDMAEDGAANPEGITVHVATGDLEKARLVAPMLARELYPGRRYGDVLYAEPCGPHAWDVSIEDHGPERPR